MGVAVGVGEVGLLCSGMIVDVAICAKAGVGVVVGMGASEEQETKRAGSKKVRSEETVLLCMGCILTKNSDLRVLAKRLWVKSSEVCQVCRHLHLSRPLPQERKQEKASSREYDGGT